VKRVQTERFVSRLTRDTLALILAGGRGSRLRQLTLWRAKPAVPFGGKFRIIDFPLSNCMNSGIRRVGILTQYKAHSLLQHIQKGWGFLRGEFGEFVELLPAQQRIETSWYVGTADAVYQNIDIIRGHDPRYVLILAGDHVYKMDYGPMIARHVGRDADMTVGCIDVPLARAGAFGIMSVSPEGQVTGFTEKPEQPEPIPGQQDLALASMGIYIFNTAFLYEQLIKDADTPYSTHDFGKDIIPAIIDQYRVMAYPFRDVHGSTSAAGDTSAGMHEAGQRKERLPRMSKAADPQSGRQAYWRDVGTVDAYWEANMELIGVTPELNLYDEDWPIWTYQEQLPPAKFVFDDDDRRGMAVDSMVSGGCIIAGSVVRHSLLFSNVHVDSFSTIRDSMVLPDVSIGRHCRLTRVVIEKGCDIPDGTVIGEDPEIDARKYSITPAGVVVVTPEMLGQDLHHVR
jgi:glucose-1-phosphate adenylyltransferase